MVMYMSENSQNIFIDLSDCHPLIASLFKTIISGKKPKRDWFSNDVNYYYYMFYIRRKLLARDGRFFVFGHEICKNYTKSLYIAKNYIVADIKVKISRLGMHDYYNYYTYVVGVDTTYKLFVNRIPSTIIIDDTDCITTKDLRIMKIDDNKIHEILGYDVDCDLDEYTTINVAGRYRVQGEIIIRAIELINPLERVINDFDYDIKHYIIVLAQDRMYGTLLELGYSPRIHRVGPDVDITLDINANEKGFEKFVYNVAKGLSKYFYKISSEVDTKYATIYVSHHDLGNLIYHFQNYKFAKRIMITCQHEDIYQPTKGNIYLKTIDEIKNMFEKLPRDDFEFFIGEHRIKVKNAYSLRMTYTPEIQPIFINTLNVSSYENSFIVFQDSIVEITHREHGKKIVKFSGMFNIEFDTTNVANTFLMERNKVVNYILAKNKP